MCNQTSTIIIGPRKTGSTSFYSLLNPAFDNTSGLKESYFWNSQYFKYLSLDKKFVYNQAFSSEPSYFSDLRAYTSLSQSTLDLKIIVVLRDPYKRFISHYRHGLSKGYYNSSVNPALAIERYPCLWYDSLYSVFLPLWMSRFDTIVIDFDDLISDLENVLFRLSSFLSKDLSGLPKILPSDNITPNSRGYLLTKSAVIFHRLLSPLFGETKVFKSLTSFSKSLVYSNSSSFGCDFELPDSLACALSEEKAFMRSILSSRIADSS